MSNASPIERKLTTILAADAANYSGRMAQDEEGTVQALRATRTILEAQIAAKRGRVANTAGDGLIAEFPSVVDAVAAAIKIQYALSKDRGTLPFRLGVHLGDVIIDGTDLLGDGVNIAARLQELAPTGGILVSRPVADQVQNRLDLVLVPLSPAHLKHMPEPMDLFAVDAIGVTLPDESSLVSTRADIKPVAPRAPKRITMQESLHKARKQTLIFAAIGIFSSFFAGPFTLVVFAALAARPGYTWYQLTRP